jgi:hypothetical protein
MYGLIFQHLENKLCLVEVFGHLEKKLCLIQVFNI